MATFNKFQDFVEKLGKGIHDLSADALKVALTNSAPNASTAAGLADITQIAAGNGYTTGGFALTGVTYTETAGVGTLSASDLVITASGGTMATFRYAVLYNDTQTGDPLICYWDQGSTISLANSESVTLKFSDNTPAGKILDVQ